MKEEGTLRREAKGKRKKEKGIKTGKRKRKEGKRWGIKRTKKNEVGR